MAKAGKQANKKHNKKKDRKGKKQRSKEEHFKRKAKEKQKRQQEEYEKTRYDLELTARLKLETVLLALKKHKEQAVNAATEVCEMLDNGYEVDLTDLEDGFIREQLEKVLQVYEKQVDRSENDEGVFVYSRSGKKSLVEQISKFVPK